MVADTFSQSEISIKDIKMSEVNITKMSATNSILEPEVQIELGGKVRVLRLDFNALALIEERTGKTISDMNDWKSLSAKHMRSMIWAALVHEDETLTEHQVGRWLSLQVFPIAIQKFSEAMFVSMKGDAPTPGAVAELAGSVKSGPLALVTEDPQD
jgi:hypothetical protein